MASENQAQVVVALLSLIAKGMVDKPDEVSITQSTEGNTILLRLRVAPTDTDKVIGKSGRTARSLRVILGAIGQTQGQNYSLDIVGQYED